MATQAAQPQQRMQGGPAQAPGQYNVNGAAGGAQSTAAQGYNPLQPWYMPNAPTGIATTGKASTLTPGQLNAFGPQATIQQILQGFAPQARQSTDALNNTLAAEGIVGGGAQGAQQLLQGQLASSIAPTLANAIQGSEGMQLQGELSNQNALNQMTLANMGARNQMTGLNLQDIMQTNAANMQAGNQANSQLAGYLQQGWQLPMEAMMQLYSGALSGASGLAQTGANNFAVPPPQNLFTMLGL